MKPWERVEVTVPAEGTAYVHFEAPLGRRTRGFEITPDHLYVESIKVGNVEQMAFKATPIPARAMNGRILDLPQGRVTLKLRSLLLEDVNATVRALQ